MKCTYSIIRFRSPFIPKPELAKPFTTQNMIIREGNKLCFGTFRISNTPSPTDRTTRNDTLRHSVCQNPRRLWCLETVQIPRILLRHFLKKCRSRFSWHRIHVFFGTCILNFQLLQKFKKMARNNRYVKCIQS